MLHLNIFISLTRGIWNNSSMKRTPCCPELAKASSQLARVRFNFAEGVRLTGQGLWLYWGRARWEGHSSSPCPASLMGALDDCSSLPRVAKGDFAAYLCLTLAPSSKNLHAVRYPEQGSPSLSHLAQPGRRLSHFTRRLLQVSHARDARASGMPSGDGLELSPVNTAIHECVMMC